MFSKPCVSKWLIFQKHNEKHKGMFTKDRARNRSKTFPGIAKAMAKQRGTILIKEMEKI